MIGRDVAPLRGAQAPRRFHAAPQIVRPDNRAWRPSGPRRASFTGCGQAIIVCNIRIEIHGLDCVGFGSAIVDELRRVI